MTGAGRVVLQLALAGLLLMLAVGIRPIKPQPRLRIERRSPLEHVGALARAWAAVHASGRAVRLLVRGLRRRHGGLRARADETAYLLNIATQSPATETDVQRVIEALQQGDAAVDAAALIPALQRIERVMAS
jgi:hypothetical protein